MSDSPPEVSDGIALGDAELTAVINDAREDLVWAGRNLEQNDLPDLADRIASQLASPPAPTLVVIGQVNSGKSLLVNSLLGQPGASRVHADVATSAFLRFVPTGQANGAGETTLLFADERRQTINNAELADWVTTHGRYVTNPAIDELPVGAEVVVDDLVLPALTIVDTPGAGGLNPNALRLVTMASTQATALLMTCDAAAPISGPELSFLRSISGETSSVVIAVTKIDKNLRNWRSIVDKNRQLLRQHAPCFADVPIVGVSSWLAVAALQMDVGERREAAFRASGLLQLLSCLDATDLWVANALRAVRAGLERVLEILETRRSALDESAAQLIDQRARLDARRRERDGGWQGFLAGEVNAVQSRTVLSLGHQSDELQAWWRRRIRAARDDIWRRPPELFVADMTADLEVLIKKVGDEYVEALTQLVGGRHLDAEVAIDGFGEVGVRGEMPHRRLEALWDTQMIQYGWSAILVGGTVAGLLGFSKAGFAAVMFTLGYLAVFGRFQVIKSGRQNHIQWLSATANAVRTDVNHEIQAQTNSVRPIIIAEYSRQLSESIAQLRTAIDDAETAATENADALNNLEKADSFIRKRIAAIDTLLKRYTPTTI